MNTTNRIKGMQAFAEALRRQALDAGCNRDAANNLVWRLLAEEKRRAVF